MSKNRRSVAAAFVAAGGFFVSGCCALGPEDDINVGRYCASPVEGGQFCVSTEEGPAAAWNQAKANGTEPIQMWAVWPENLELDEVVAFPHQLKAWLDDVRIVLDYVRVTKNNAESYQASLSGKLRDDLLRARSLQSAIINEKSVVTPEGVVLGQLTKKLPGELDPLKLEIATDKQKMGDVLAIVEQAKLDGAPYAAKYKTLVDDFAAYRATEAAETLLYTQWSYEVSGAGIDELLAIENGIVDAAHKASAAPNEFLVAGMQLSAEILQFEKTSRTALEPHAEYMLSQGAKMPDLSSGALRSIYAMLGYTQQRLTRSDATAKMLVLGVGMRRRALQLLADAPSPLRATIANALLKNASTAFEESSQIQVNALATTTMNSKLGLPYLAKRFDEHAALLQMAALCNPNTSSWRESGCASMRPNFKDAGNYLQTTLPAEITLGLTVLKNKGADINAIQKAQQKLDAGDIKGAAMAHDALLAAQEGT